LTVVVSEVQPIKTILHNRPITARTDESKRRDKIFYNDGRLKVSKEPIEGRSLTLISLDRFDSRHYCALCQSRGKSQTVALVKDNFTGESFYMAGDCSRNHFAEDLDKLAAASNYSTSIFEKTLQIIGFQAEDNLEAVVVILDRFDDLINFPCTAIDEAQAMLRMMLEDRSGLALGKYDDDISDLDALISFQYEHRYDRDLFEARWRALKTHPNRRSRKSEWQSVQKMVDQNQRDDLTLGDFRAIRNVLTEIYGSAVKLRNPEVDPADFSTKKAYEDALYEHYCTKADIMRDPQVNYHFIEDKSYLENLYQALDDLPLVLAVSSYHLVKQKLATYELKNTATLRRLTGNQIRFYVSREIRLEELKCRSRKEDKKGKYRVFRQKMHYIVIALWRPDVWQPAYNEWHKYGRNALESLPSDFNKHKSKSEA